MSETKQPGEIVVRVEVRDDCPPRLIRNGKTKFLQIAGGIGSFGGANAPIDPRLEEVVLVPYQELLNQGWLLEESWPTLDMCAAMMPWRYNLRG